MIENVWRKVVFILVLITASLIFFGTWNIRRGLDLRGGARLVYKLDISAAKKKGQVDRQTSDKDVLNQTIDILRQRIDPQGVLEASIQRQGSDRILIEIPGRKESEIASVRRRIQQLGKLEWRLVIDESLKSFDIAEEKKALEDWLKKPANQKIVGQNPEEIRVFNSLKAERGGPKRPGMVAWFPMYKDANPHKLEVAKDISWKDAKGVEQKGKARYLPISLEKFDFSTDKINQFKGEDLQAGSIKQTQGQSGQPAVAFRLKQNKVADFTTFTDLNKDRCFAIILNGYVRSAPVIKSRLPGAGIIEGRFTPEEIRNLILTLKTGSLKIKPKLESESTLGPTVGEQAIKTGTLSMILGGLAVVVFMALFYRLAGMVAVISLLVNMILIMGIMALFRFTLTLPGLAGLVLTVGMAVDANILIFERIREELDKGKVLMQAVKNGFAMALSTIVDANLTTLITALILYKVGTGPIRGFAVTLSVGILTSMFAALVVSRVIFHLGAEFKLIKNLKMGRVFTKPAFRFLAMRKPAMVLSFVLVVLGILIFSVVDRDTKLGIDFTGGASIRITLKSPQNIEEVRNKIVAKIPSAVVNTLGGGITETGIHITGNQAQNFAVKFKLSQEATDLDAIKNPEKTSAEDGNQYRNMLRDALKGWLVSEPYSDFHFWEGPDKTFSIVKFQIHSEAPVKKDALVKALAGYESLVVEPSDPKEKGKPEAVNFNINFNTELGTSEEDIKDMIAPRLAKVKDANGDALQLTEPFPEFETIGARVVGELQSSAIVAIILSLFTVIMYIRVRFHEYKYGIAAVVALVHDVTIALGMVTLCNALGIVNAEIDLPLIAAFLTIIGYSLNDTIVVFDRIRENLPRLPGSYEEVINTSINQTLSRTIWTSLTTFMVLLAIFVLNFGQRNVLEGFSFAMLIGVVVGTYSSIFIASPVLVMLHKKENAGQG